MGADALIGEVVTAQTPAVSAPPMCGAFIRVASEIDPKCRAGRQTTRVEASWLSSMHNPGMDETKLNLPEHLCSKCRRSCAIREFPYPREAWWCRWCWRAFRIKQNEERRAQRHAALEEDFSRPPRGGWQAEHFRSKGTIDDLSPSESLMFQMELNRLYERCRQEGRPLTQQKIASLKGNAVFIVRYVRTGRALSRTGNYWKRRKLWERLQKGRQLEEFKAKPIEERHRFLSVD